VAVKSAADPITSISTVWNDSSKLRALVPPGGIGTSDTRFRKPMPIRPMKDEDEAEAFPCSSV
jgi:hypothetical protein